MNNHEFHMINEDQLRAAAAKGVGGAGATEEGAAAAAAAAVAAEAAAPSYLQSYLNSGVGVGGIGCGPASVLPELISGMTTVDYQHQGLNRATSGSSPTSIPPILSLKHPFASFGTSKMHADGSYSLAPVTMKYRNIGKNGLRVPLLAFAAWQCFGQLDEAVADSVLTTAYENGINYFDTGDAFAGGAAEVMLGSILKRKAWRRSSYIVSSKLFWKGGPSTHLGGGLSRKFIIEAVEASLRRLQLKYIDILIIHKLDAMCPMEEIVRTMSYLIKNGIIFYWGCSRFAPMHLSEAFCIARQFNCPPPIAEQMLYDMNVREKMELQMLELFHKSGIGCITWSPISLSNDPGIVLLTRRQTFWGSGLGGGGGGYFGATTAKCTELVKLCAKLGCDLTQLSLAWSLQNENVNTVLITASSVPELFQKLNAIKLYSLLNTSINEEIERILQNNPVLKRQMAKTPSITVDVPEPTVGSGDGDEAEEVGD
ncbi:PREDICTED: voltage-gated potassium channel subunit beta-2-like [Rhagoletis zephyria]|uniref:voltage-gated potassium channel subunit beta-2-like n=1 Tax=Rhagoletis zephyria TaxID=28612 RepID=UPI00081122E5|nr:PREDICTED: voltage-gated potassium channel subunit beta-2-like [Rhagoletis zephyria]